MGTVCVVGNGPSPIGRGLGSEVDRHEVIRIKNPDWQKVEDYGKRSDYLIGSTASINQCFESKRYPKEYWVGPKKMNPGGPYKKPVRVMTDLYAIWRPKFLELVDEKVCWDFSAGTAAILGAFHYLSADEVFVIGCDNLKDPTTSGYSKGDRGKWHTRHDFGAERMLIEHFANRISWL